MNRAYNLNQLFRQALNRRPLGCVCTECHPGDIDYCSGCKALLSCCRLSEYEEKAFCLDCAPSTKVFSIDLKSGAVEIHNQERYDRMFSLAIATSEVGGDR